jgi:hypothetical protein
MQKEVSYARTVHKLLSLFQERYKKIIEGTIMNFLA